MIDEAIDFIRDRSNGENPDLRGRFRMMEVTDRRYKRSAQLSKRRIKYNEGEETIDGTDRLGGRMVVAAKGSCHVK